VFSIRTSVKQLRMQQAIVTIDGQCTAILWDKSSGVFLKKGL